MECVEVEIRMIENISKRITQFYQIAIFVILLSTLSVILYFWKLGFLDGSRGKDLHKASYILETYESKQLLNQVKTFIFEQDPKLAIEKIKEVESDFEKIDKQVEVKEFEAVKKNLQALKLSSAELISYPKIEKVQEVFSTKMLKFYDYVKSNNWRTLTRMSDRIFAQINGHINEKKIDELATHISRDFSSMIKITEGSILERKDKSEVINRIQNLQIEIDMLSKYAIERNKFMQIHEQTQGLNQKWFSAVAPEITFQKIQIEQIGRTYVMGLVGILSIVTMLFFGSFLFNKLTLKRMQKMIENEMKNVISDSVIEGEKIVEGMYSKEFESFVVNNSDYIHKRMSFGSIFQDALPLSSLLLDQNLKVLWANKQFCTDWMIPSDEINKEFMSWDFLNKLTNIGHNDPVLEALKHNVAGIYQVQIKPNEETSSRPFEMFVAPVNYQNEKRIMLFFYDLTNLEQTIQDQAKSLIAPIEKSLNNLANGEFDQDGSLQNEFQIAGVEEIYEQFLTLHNRVVNEQTQLLDEVEFLHNEITNLESSKSSLYSIINKNISLSKENIESLKNFKDGVIGLSTFSKELERTVQHNVQILNSNNSALKNSSQKLVLLKNTSAEIINTVPKFNKLKEEIRETKTTLAESKAKLGHELSQTSILLKRINDNNGVEKVTRSLQKVNDTFTHTNALVESLDKKISNLELLMSKAQIVFNTAKEKIVGVNNDFELQQIKLTDDQIKMSSELRLSSSNKIENFDSLIVQSMKEMFQSVKSGIAINSSLREENPLLSNDQELRGEQNA